MRKIEGVEKCQTCKFSKRNSATYHKTYTCDYLSIMGAPRGCPIGEDCDKYVEKKARVEKK